MIITFKTKSHGDVTMFGDVALRLIKIMGHGGTVPGAIAADEVEQAVARLEAAVAKDRAETGGAKEDEEEGGERPVSLAHRALPLIELMRAAAENDAPVMWAN
jgi:hypothetical protein